MNSNTPVQAFQDVTRKIDHDIHAVDPTARLQLEDPAGGYRFQSTPHYNEVILAITKILEHRGVKRKLDIFAPFVKDRIVQAQCKNVRSYEHRQTRITRHAFLRTRRNPTE